MNAAALRFAVNRALGWNRLRSDWYSVHMDGQNVVFDGRGYGHGVGLCQAGAAEMAGEGKPVSRDTSFPILRVRPCVCMRATKVGMREEENGWTLRAAGVDAEFVKAGNAAWADARSRWGATSAAKTVVDSGARYRIVSSAYERARVDCWPRQAASR